MATELLDVGAGTALRVLKATLMSNSGGSASVQTESAVFGKVFAFKVVPDSGGTQPTGNFDVTVVDDDGVDAIRGGGTDMSNAAAFESPVLFSSQICPYVAGNQNLTIAAANMGNAKGATVYVYILA